MQRAALNFATAMAFVILADQAQGQKPASTNSYAQELLRFDRNGNGKLDEAERAALAAENEPAELPFSGLPLICEGEATGAGGGGGSSVSEIETQVEAQLPAGLGRQAVWRFQRHPLRQPAGAPLREQPPQEQAELDANDYQVQTPPIEQPSSPPRSVGLSKAVQYRLLANRERQQTRPTRFRQAAVFGATIGLSKREPARYRPVQSSCCGCTRVDIYIPYR